MQSGLDITFQEELRHHMDMEQDFRIELVQTYALIYSNYCTKTMQVRIEEHPDFTTKIRNDPIELLEVIKTLTHDPVRALSIRVNARLTGQPTQPEAAREQGYT